MTGEIDLHKLIKVQFQALFSFAMPGMCSEWRYRMKPQRKSRAEINLWKVLVVLSCAEFFQQEALIVRLIFSLFSIDSAWNSLP